MKATKLFALKAWAPRQAVLLKDNLTPKTSLVPR